MLYLIGHGDIHEMDGPRAGIVHGFNQYPSMIVRGGRNDDHPGSGRALYKAGVRSIVSTPRDIANRENAPPIYE